MGTPSLVSLLPKTSASPQAPFVSCTPHPLCSTSRHLHYSPHPSRHLPTGLQACCLCSTVCSHPEGCFSNVCQVRRLLHCLPSSGFLSPLHKSRGPYSGHWGLNWSIPLFSSHTSLILIYSSPGLHRCRKATDWVSRCYESVGSEHPGTYAVAHMWGCIFKVN